MLARPEALSADSTNHVSSLALALSVRYVSSDGYNVKDIIYRWARKDTAVERDKEISLPQFDIVKTVQKYRLEELSSGKLLVYQYPHAQSTRAHTHIHITWDYTME